VIFLSEFSKYLEGNYKIIKIMTHFCTFVVVKFLLSYSVFCIIQKKKNYNLKKYLLEKKIKEKFTNSLT